MNPAKRARVEAWLRYGEELGVTPFFRDRATMMPAQTEAVESAPSIEMAAARPKFAPARPAPPAMPAAARPIVAAAAGPSLFEAVERVEGDSLPRIREDIGDCTRCRLHKGRTKIVYGTGNPKAELVFVGEGPGHDEDVQGEPFVGRAGKLLT